MIVIKRETLESQGTLYETCSKIVFGNKQFSKGSSFSKRIYQQIAAILEEDYQKNKTVYLLVDLGDQFTVWHEVKNSPPTTTSSGRLKQQILTKQHSPFSQVDPADGIADTELRFKPEDKVDVADGLADTELRFKPEDKVDDAIAPPTSHQDTQEQVSSSQAGVEKQTDSTATIQLKYRGVTYYPPESHLVPSNTHQSAEASSPQKKSPRNYRGRPY